jgi:hypothetical protein
MEPIVLLWQTVPPEYQLLTLAAAPLVGGALGYLVEKTPNKVDDRIFDRVKSIFRKVSGK